MELVNEPINNTDVIVLAGIGLAVIGIIFYFSCRPFNFKSPLIVDDERECDFTMVANSPTPEQGYIQELLAINKSIANDLSVSYKTEGYLREDLAAARIEVISLKAIVENLRKQKIYDQQKFYNPADHKEPTMYVCAQWKEWMMIRRGNWLEPQLISREQWDIEYGHLVVLPSTNSNLKKLA